MKKHMGHLNDPEIRCEPCNKKFSRPDALIRHNKDLHGGSADQSDETELSGSSADPQPPTSAAHPPATHSPPSTATDQRQPSTSTAPPTFSCPQCHRSYKYQKNLTKHMNKSHTPTEEPANPQPSPTPSFNLPPDDPRDFSQAIGVPGELRGLFRKNWRYIRTSTQSCGFITRYNFRMRNCTPDRLALAAKRIFNTEKKQFKIDVSAGLVLLHKVDGTLRYFYPEKNNSLIDRPVLIGNSQDLEKFIELLQGIDIHQYGLLNRDNTAYTTECVTNVLFMVYRTKALPVGHDTHGSEPEALIQDAASDAGDEASDSNERSTDDERIREYIHRKRSMLSFIRNSNNGYYTDNLCFFRALYSKTHDNTRVPPGNGVKDLFLRWAEAKGLDTNPDSFPGVEISDLPALEKLFQINILVYELSVGPELDELGEDGDINEQIVARDERLQDGGEVDVGLPDISASLIYRSLADYKSVLHLNKNFGHFSLITNISRYCNAYRCPNCDNIFNSHVNYNRHTSTCINDIKLVYPGGGFAGKKTVFDRLDDLGVHVPPEKRFYDLRAVFDFECILPPTATVRSDKLEYTHHCIPASVSLAHNITDDPESSYSEPVCFIDADPNKLIERFYSQLVEFSALAKERMRHKFADVIQKLEAERSRLTQLKQTLAQLRRNKAAEEHIEIFENAVSEAKVWLPVCLEFERWVNTLPVIGFNSGGFDLQLIREYFVPYLMSHEIRIDQPVIRNGNYMMFCTEDVLFLDMMNYLAAGTSYAKFLKAFQIEEGKGHFCYSAFTSVEMLDKTTSLPPKEMFYSELKQEGISDDDYVELERLWDREGFQSLRDLLIYYNNKDVAPFLRAIQKMYNIFKDIDIDMFKGGCISLPGLALRYLSKDLPTNIVFNVFNERFKHLRDLIVENIVGGPSIVFTRAAHAGVTRVKGDQVCKSVHGDDCNAMYLAKIGRKMPVGIPCVHEPLGEDTGLPMPTEGDPESAEEMANIHRIMDNNKAIVFGSEFATYGYQELFWLNHRFHQLKQEHPDKKLTLRHKFNGGQKVFRFGSKKVPVDGFIPELNFILQYHGCKFHGHQCHLTGRYSQEFLRERESRTSRIGDLLRSTLMTVEELYQCELYKMLAENRFMSQEYEDGKLPLRGEKTAESIVEAIRDGISVPNGFREEVFGIAEVDIQVPWWTPELREAFAEFPPIFKNTEVTIDDIGPTMRQFAEDNNLLTQPRRCLISSYFGTKIMLATPLLKWLLERGLVVTRLYRFIQYKSAPVFSHLVEEITNYRREADRDPSTMPLAETYKKIGNSLYGKFLQRVDKYCDVTYAHENEAHDLVMSSLFRKAVYVGSGIYEMHLAKKKVVFDMPIEIPFFVYQYAKLRMLEFKEFLDNVAHGKFELLEMDTDSLYYALTEKTLEEAVTNREYYDEHKAEFLPMSEADKRTPLLFKAEFRGDSMVCLNSKTYIAWSRTIPASNIKLSSKGISKRTTKYQPRHYMKALYGKRNISGVNLGFRMRKTRLYQYRQVRNGLGFFYIKRVVQPDGIHTTPLLI